MIHFKNFWRTLMLLVCFLLNISAFSQEIYVASTSNTDAIEANPQKIMKLLSEYRLNSDINEMIIESDGIYNYLMAKDEMNGWIYLFVLQDKNGRLYIDHKKDIHSCQCEELSIDNFIISSGEVEACNGCKHKLIEKP